MINNTSNETEYEKVMQAMEDCDKNKISWNEAMTKLLIEEVDTRINLFGVQPYKTIWKSVATAINVKGYNLNAEHCNNKWKNLKKRYKSIKDNNKQSGAGAQYWVHFKAIDDILKQNPEVTPLSIASSTGGFRRNIYLDDELRNDNNLDDILYNNNDTLTTTVRNNRRRARNVSEPYWAMQLRLQREQHHKENVELKERFLALLEKRNLNI